MLLVTLGYDAQKAGLVGINWASKTNALADENGLLEECYHFLHRSVPASVTQLS